jgi:hypothetical protein
MPPTIPAVQKDRGGATILGWRGETIVAVTAWQAS